MSAYGEFAEAFLKALYLETEKTGNEYHSAQVLIDSYGLTPKDHWISRLADAWEHSFLKDVTKTLEGYRSWSFRISAAGAQKVEDDLEADEFVNSVFPVPSNSVRLTDSFEAVVIPASDRIVRLDHNSAEYQEIAEGLSSLLSDVRSNNEIGETAEERERIVRSLGAANELWSALELKVIQIKVGVLLAVEDAGRALEKVGKATAWSLLIDLLKQLVRDKIGIEI